MIKYDIRLIGYINTFENITKAKIKDCFINDRDQLVFIVNYGHAGKAIGKKGINTKKLENLLKKKIKIIEFNDDIIIFIANLLMPIKADEIKKEEKSIQIIAKDTKTKGLLIGRNSKNLLHLKNTVKKFFDIEEIKVV